MSSTEKQYFKVGVLVFHGADILDFTGPMEVLCHVLHNHNPDDPDRMFAIEVIAQTATIRAASSLTVKADKLLADADENIAEYDLLVVPGGPPSVVNPLVENSTPEVDFVRKFAALPLPSSLRPRILFSVCTGAILLGAAGVLSGMTVTTHHRALDLLREICARFNDKRDKGDPLTNVVHKRYVDGGYLQGDAVQVVTAGGISSGLDATFHIVRELADAEMAAFVARVMEYDWVLLATSG